ncbi:hypothetical protein PG996_014808 [Apiospora saccharicola]|uniref:Heterokaryon incompatibility domain-containing protein n=1 Tax=Apiospora saccharicola TaxID=335842 RepID=A0ABR1TM16_9PEZI
MRLLDTSTLQLRTFNAKTPAYAILSHTWGADEDEVTFQEWQTPSPETPLKRGYIKIKRFCEVARRNGYEWAWADTCCIDKSSSAELSESINSMYKWYQKSHVCYAYLEDVLEVDDIKESRWFTRGWTLQVSIRIEEHPSRSWNITASSSQQT